MSGPAPAVAAVRSAVAEELADLLEDAAASAAPAPAGPAPLVLVACSGGADSLALAAGTAFVAGRRGSALRAGAVVVDHGWHRDSMHVAAAAAAQCRRLGLDPVEVVTVGPAPGAPGGPEAAARVVRYAALEAAADRLGAAAVLLGHTLDDQAETVLLGLARGSGARSLAGMARRRGRFRRPLLHVRREQTEAACQALDLEVWQDPANDDPGYTRVRVRSALPRLVDSLGPGTIEALGRTADLLRADADALDGYAAAALASARVAAGDGAGAGRTELEVGELQRLPDAVRHRVLLAALRETGCPPGQLARRHVQALDALVTAWRGQGPLDLPGLVSAGRSCGRLWLTRRDDRE